MPADQETPGGPLRGSPGTATGAEPSATAAAGGEKKPAPSKKVKKALTLAALYVLMFISVASTLMLIAVAVYSSPVTAEIGGRPDLSRYETGLASKICSVDANNDLSTDRIEDKELTLVFFGFIKKNVPLHVKDTTPPTVSARKVTTVTGTILSPGDFIKSVEDKTEVSLDFTGDPPVGRRNIGRVHIRQRRRRQRDRDRDDAHRRRHGDRRLS